MRTDSLRIIESGDGTLDELPVVSLSENERSENAISFTPSLLTSNRDVFMNTASFHFNIVRFRMRGYDAQWSSAFINGMPVNNPADGNIPWAYWTGLNDVTRNTQMVLALRAGDMDFGNIGTTVSMDMRAYKQREQTQFSYSLSNRSYSQRWMFSSSRGFNKKGWAYSISGSFRYAGEGYVPGTSYRGGSYYLGIDHKIKNGAVLSLVFFGAATENGRQSPVLEEIKSLAGTPRYNAYWGYQSGKKRNANMGRSHVPVLIMNYERQLDNHSSLLLSVGGMAGARSATALDWYNAPDPRPDYYRYLPSYQKDSVLKSAVANEISGDLSRLQVNWSQLYEINRNSFEATYDADGITGNTVRGKRSHYIIEERITGTRRLAMNMVYSNATAPGLGFTTGASLEWQQLHHYKKIDDLLGGEYYVDWNQFAEGNATVIQNDLNRPNRILHQGDEYGHNYAVTTTLAKVWAQWVIRKKKTDLFIAGKVIYTNYFRDGKVQTGLFPYNSLGRSRLHEYTNHALKAGITYKINGRKYLYFHASILSSAPFFDNVFVSPRTNDTEQENITSETIQTLEAGYIWNAPSVKMRFTGYFTKFSGGMNMLTFYHDGYRSFVNYALSGIDKLHFGGEYGAEMKLNSQFTLQLAAAVGRYYFANRQQVTVSADNDAYVAERGLIFSKNFRIAGSPQEAYSLGLSYQSSGAFYCNLSANYFRQQWLEFNPIRRTHSVLRNLAPGSEQWKSFIEQIVLPDQSSVDFSAGTSLRVKPGRSKKRHTLFCNLSISNLLDNRDIISGGYEQLRYDAVNNDVKKFPPKFFHAMGFNYSLNISMRW